MKPFLLRKYIPFFISLMLLAALIPPFTIHANDSSKIVRVGWYESSFNMTDIYGRRSGYGYEYQMKVASYSGWKYEYITGSWTDLMEMLEDGELDLLSDVSYTEERSEKMLYPELPMGTEEYYLFISHNNRNIEPTDLSTLSGKKIGVNKNSIQRTFFEEWAKENNVEPEIVEITCTEDESLTMLEQGELDAFITVDSNVSPDRALPVCKIGSSDFYFAVNKNRPDLLEDLNESMDRILDEDRNFNERMFEKYIKRAGANAFLTRDEVEWLSSRKSIRIGYEDNYLSFCAADEDGELTGILKDFLDAARGSVANARLDFETIAYPTAEDALNALKNGEVDCVFPANLSTFDGEEMGLLMTPPLISTDIYAVIRESEQKYFAGKEHVIVAVGKGNPNYEAVLRSNFPHWRKVFFEDNEACLRAVSEGVADCVLISNYRYNNIAREADRLHLTSLTTGFNVDFCFAVLNGEKEAYSIMTKAIGLIPEAMINGALSYYLVEDSRVSFMDFVVDHLSATMLLVGSVIVLILFLMIRSMNAERIAKKLISETEIDDLTGLYNRDFFFQYANRMFHDHPDVPMDAIVLNIEQFHSVNALNGRDFGNEVLRALGNELYNIALETRGIAGRFEADRFDLYCRQTNDYRGIFDRLQKKLDDLSANTSIRLRMGVMPWQEKLEPVQMFDRANVACSMARGHYNEHLIVFDEDVRDREIYEQLLLNDLRRALDQFEFEVYYQPKFNIQTTPSKLVSAEALIRWQHPDRGMIPPDDFIPLFEKNGRISELDRYVWEEAAKQIVRWRDQYGVLIPVSVNLSRVDVFDPDLEDTLEKILRINNLGYDALKLEVTESAYTENADQVIRVVEGLRRKGFEVEMDDFGTGYSSLNMLSAMPVDVLKMDRGFIRNIDNSEKDVQLVALILGIARNLKIPVIAEGVETLEQLKILRDLGCEMVQGYYFSRPLRASEFELHYVKG